MDDRERAHWERRERKRGVVRVRVRLLTTAEGGRHGPIADGYRASWDIGNQTDAGEWTSNDAPLLLEDRESLAPGETATGRIHPIAPELWTNVSPGLEITMHEGRRIVGRGEVLEVVGSADADASGD
jgi:translation elongation factor EF-Tu-like GTPase